MDSDLLLQHYSPVKTAISVTDLLIQEFHVKERLGEKCPCWEEWESDYNEKRENYQ